MTLSDLEMTLSDLEIIFLQIYAHFSIQRNKKFKNVKPTRFDTTSLDIIKKKNRANS